ncbi:DUF3431 domain-containing protein [Micromonospora sp. NPDC049559]|uniref:DUF3431 domain-containing protein n=1 Tax=Micromonospora sp. NPDC049559 TaxID=3155923 RepID=UPI00344930FF
MTNHGPNEGGTAGLAQLVLAHYQEDLQWLREQSWDAVIIYTKGSAWSATDSDYPKSQLPNIGREAHTYLHHIVTNYDNLADITIFSQAGLADHVEDVRVASLVRQAAAARSPGMVGFGLQGRSFRHWEGIRYYPKWAQQLEAGGMRRAALTPGQFYQWAFGEKPPPYIPFYPGAILGVHRHAILARRKSFYGRLLEHFERLGHSNPEEAHYMERFWVAVFDPGWVERAISVRR